MRPSGTCASCGSDRCCFGPGAPAVWMISARLSLMTPPSPPPQLCSGPWVPPPLRPSPASPGLGKPRAQSQAGAGGAHPSALHCASQVGSAQQLAKVGSAFYKWGGPRKAAYPAGKGVQPGVLRAWAGPGQGGRAGRGGRAGHPRAAAILLRELRMHLPLGTSSPVGWRRFVSWRIKGLPWNSLIF